MSNCKYTNCKYKTMKLIGGCKGCEKYYCHLHRYPEAHSCIKLLEIKLNQKQTLVSKLMNESITNEKLTRI